MEGGIDPSGLVWKCGIDPSGLAWNWGIGPSGLAWKGGIGPSGLVWKCGIDPSGLVWNGGIDPSDPVWKGGMDPSSLRPFRPCICCLVLTLKLNHNRHPADFSTEVTVYKRGQHRRECSPFGQRHQNRLLELRLTDQLLKSFGKRRQRM